MPTKSYYERNRKRILAKMKKKYWQDSKFRKTAKRKSRKRYHEDPAYRAATIKRAKKRYRLKKKTV